MGPKLVALERSLNRIGQVDGQLPDHPHPLTVDVDGRRACHPEALRFAMRTSHLALRLLGGVAGFERTQVEIEGLRELHRRVVVQARLTLKREIMIGPELVLCLCADRTQCHFTRNAGTVDGQVHEHNAHFAWKLADHTLDDWARG